MPPPIYNPCFYLLGKLVDEPLPSNQPILFTIAFVQSLKPHPFISFFLILYDYIYTKYRCPKPIKAIISVVFRFEFCTTAHIALRIFFHSCLMPNSFHTHTYKYICICVCFFHHLSFQFDFSDRFERFECQLTICFRLLELCIDVLILVYIFYAEPYIIIILFSIISFHCDSDGSPNFWKLKAQFQTRHNGKVKIEIFRYYCMEIISGTNGPISFQIYYESIFE